MGAVARFETILRFRIGLHSFDLWLEECFFAERGKTVISEEKKLWAVELLQAKHKENGRLPKKDDFDEITVSRIKAFLGPWPRALEAAGLKEAKTRQKRRL